LKNQESRRRRIVSILQDGRIHSQEELLERLQEDGVEVTQATLSRDLKFLSVARVPDDKGEYFYSVESPVEPVRDPYIRDDMKREIRSVQFSGNMCVVKTKTGHAPGIAFGIDQLRIEQIVGSVGGEDTILIVLKEGTDRKVFLKSLMGE
jgi:transcriptional regulator of arginine metabolism